MSKKIASKFDLGRFWVLLLRGLERFGASLGHSWVPFAGFFLRLKSICFATLVQHGLQEPVGTDFGRVLGGSGRAWGRFLNLFYQISFNF